MANKEKEDKKIIIDEDWKQQAKKEKDVIVSKEQTEDKGTKQRSAGEPLPDGSIAALVNILVTQAFFALGLLHVEGQARHVDLEVARFNIDLLEVLEKKTKGNLTDEESKILESALGELRMVYVKIAGM
jgi:hypothetical protein